MRNKVNFSFGLVLVISTFLFSCLVGSQAQTDSSPQLINPEALVKVLQSTRVEKPLLLQVGSHVLFSQAHIPGSEYVGASSSQTGLRQLRNRVESLPRSKFIVIYCGCCPFEHCPNVRPAIDALKELKFTNFFLLDIPHNIKKDWIDQGFPVSQ